MDKLDIIIKILSETKKTDFGENGGEIITSSDGPVTGVYGPVFVIENDTIFATDHRSNNKSLNDGARLHSAGLAYYGVHTVISLDAGAVYAVNRK